MPPNGGRICGVECRRSGPNPISRCANENCQLHSFIMPFLVGALSPAYPSFAGIYFILHINIVKSAPPVALHKISPPFMPHSVHAVHLVCEWAASVVGWLGSWTVTWVKVGDWGHINLSTGRHAAVTSVATKECDPVRFDSLRLGGSSKIVNISHRGREALENPMNKLHKPTALWALRNIQLYVNYMDNYNRLIFHTP